MRRGHIEVGCTAAIFFIIIGIAVWTAVVKKPIDEVWMELPLWGKVASIVGPIVILGLGYLFESGRRWPNLSSAQIAGPTEAPSHQERAEEKNEGPPDELP